MVGCNVLLKLENLQPSGSFKSRGIGNLILSKIRNAASPAKVHFYSSSGGNAGLACVDAATSLGFAASVVVPLTTSPLMVAKIEKAGAREIVQRGASWQEADDFLVGQVMPAARARGEEPVYVPPFDAPEIWDGYAAIPVEIWRQLQGASLAGPNGQGQDHDHNNGQDQGQDSDQDQDQDQGQHLAKIDAIICSVGGGGLLCGIMQGLDSLATTRHRPRLIAMETAGADSLAQSLLQQQHVTLAGITSLATSLGARRVAEQAFRYALRSHQVTSVVLTDEDAICACRRFLDEERFLVELACGVCLALCYHGRVAELVPGFSRDSVVVVVVCGGSNMSLGMLTAYMDRLPLGCANQDCP
ncbi:hypothetical protein CDD81_4832 [Ophiocordyceps australis]|uniref:L-serine ammonia-lyase n=1 Tax=Ophiocordyceps australis TaxID=1399860 RepID=A0A2C5XIU7_9HYPO|nr:hypothetical protein CDD81_4832 [Ophiocordyceps australis]